MGSKKKKSRGAAVAAELARRAQPTAPELTPDESASQPAAEAAPVAKAKPKAAKPPKAKAKPAAEAESEGRTLRSFQELGQALRLPPAAPSGRGKASGPAETRAGVQAYDQFFGLYAQSLAGEGLQFWPLGFIPGPALLTYGGNEVVAATSDVAHRIGALPRSVGDLPSEVLDGMQAWANLAHGLGFQPAAWADGSARRLLSGRKPDGPLVIGMPRFRYRGGDNEVPFGVVLEPASGELRLARVYNPRGVGDAPTEGTVLKLSELKDGRGPIQKLVRTHALMEANFASRYHRDGTPREDRERDER